MVAYSNKCEAIFKDVSHLQSNQEEADTKLLLCAYDATVSGARRIDIYSPDTDVFRTGDPSLPLSVPRYIFCHRKEFR